MGRRKGKEKKEEEELLDEVHRWLLRACESFCRWRSESQSAVVPRLMKTEGKIRVKPGPKKQKSRLFASGEILIAGLTEMIKSKKMGSICDEKM